MPRRGRARLNRISIFSFQRSQHLISIAFALAYIPPNTMKGFHFLHSPVLLIFESQMMTIISEVSWTLTAVLICISLMAKDPEDCSHSPWEVSLRSLHSFQLVIFESFILESLFSISLYMLILVLRRLADKVFPILQAASSLWSLFPLLCRFLTW